MRPLSSFRIMAVLLCASSGAGGPAYAATQVVQVNASIVKPISVSLVQDLDLGSIVLGPGTWSSATVAISRTGAFSCPSANVTCSGATQVAKYQVTGTNNLVAIVSAPNVTLVNQNDASKTLTMVVDNPGIILFGNSGNQGVTVPLGGSITLSSSTASGTYRGTFNVTVDY